MPSKRQLKFASLVKRELSEILAREIDGIGNTILTVSHLEVSPDLKQVKVYMTALPDSALSDIILFLNENQPQVRHLLARRLSHIKSIPELIFFEDDLEKEARKVEQLFEDIGPIPEEKDDDGLDETYPNA